MKKNITASILLVGATAMVAQIVLFRELIIVFYGNEMSVGLMLASWLLLGAAGSFFLGRFADNVKRKFGSFAVCQISLSVILPSALIAIRSIKKILSLVPGEIIGLEAAALFSFIILAPVCIILGYLFALSCRIYKLKNPAERIGKVYILEAVGAASGGIIVSFFLIKWVSSFEILAGLSLLNIAASLLLSKGFFRGLSFLWLVIALALFAGGPVQRLDQKTLELEWSPLELLSSRNSIYSNLAVTRTGKEISFFSNGLHNFTVPDELTQEETAHFGLLEHENPKDVLLIGGGQGGVVWEILKHPVIQLDYVELDPVIVEMGNTFLADTEYFVKEDPRVKVINTDGRFWVKNTSRKYDCIIINLPNPFTAQINRFYTLEFFRELGRVMKPGGVLSFGLVSSENYISKDLAAFLGSINNTLKSAFPEVRVIPGDTAYFLASNKRGALNVDYRFLSARLKKRGVNTEFVRDYYLFSRLSTERLDYINNILEKNTSSETNRDFKPVSYYFDSLLWATHFSGPLKNILPILTEPRIWLGLCLALMFLAAAYYLIKNNPNTAARAVTTAIGTTGFSEIAFEITVILAFQVIYGFMYYKLGLMLSSFMVGLTLGSLYITQRMHKLKDALGVFIKIQVCIALYPLILPPVFLILSAQKTPLAHWLGSNMIFPLLPAVAGFIGGLQFPLGAKIYLGKSKKTGRAGGLVYGADLAGACVGAVIISGFLIPILGIFKTCLAVSAVNLAVLVLLSAVRQLDPAPLARGGVDKPG